MQREYLVHIVINGRKLRRVWIDDHYERRHSGSITDEIILDLVNELQAARHVPEATTAAGFEIYVTEPVFREGKPYRLVWTMHPNENYLGVVNAFRRKHGKVAK